MITDELAKVLVETKKDEELLDGLVDTLMTIQDLLQPSENLSAEFCHGLAINEVVAVTKVLREYRLNKYGQKPLTVV